MGSGFDLGPIVGELRVIRSELLELGERFPRREVFGPRWWHRAGLHLVAVVVVVIAALAVGCGAW